MNAVESTPEMARGIFEGMESNLSIIRERVGRPLTLSEKLILGHLDDAHNQEITPGESYLLLRPDRVVLPDAIGQLTMLQFIQTGQDQVRLPTTVHCDHLTQAQSNGVEDLTRSLQQNNEIYDFLRTAAARYGAGFWAPGAGIAHQVVLENYAFPGALILGTDSHTPNAGGLGACAVAVGGTEAAEALAGLPWELRYPKRIAVFLTGSLNGWASPKDVILWLAGQLTVSGGTNAVIEYIGPGARTISATGKATITNMGAEVGATTSIFPADDHMATYLSATGRGLLSTIVARYRHLLVPDQEAERAPEKYYDRVIELDLSALEPHVTGPNSPDRTRPISALAAEFKAADPAFPAALSAALIGSCTNSSYEDMSRSANIANQAIQRGVRAATQFLITPGSEQIRTTIERDGQMKSLKDLGGTVLANACGPCIGQWMRDEKIAGRPNSIVTSYNRNYAGRNDGHVTTLHFMASPEVVTALALAGNLSFNPLQDELFDANGKTFRLSPPADAPEVPSCGFSDSGRFFTPPPPEGKSINVVIDPKSERLQLLAPWKVWQDTDFLDMPVLIKTIGKTTTDQIAPAGPWMRYRGHISKSSEGMLIGAVNAFTGETGKVTNILSGEKSRPVAQVAQDYKSRKAGWVIVGGSNYGEGSSREHAAITPRYLGCAAVIACSFARIHESNLKKQGLLALTFRNPDDYERIQEDDRLSLPSIADLAPGIDVKCVIRHSDGSKETVKLGHTLSDEHIRWIRAGSALNALTLGNQA